MTSSKSFGDDEKDLPPVNLSFKHDKAARDERIKQEKADRAGGSDSGRRKKRSGVHVRHLHVVQPIDVGSSDEEDSGGLRPSARAALSQQRSFGPHGASTSALALATPASAPAQLDASASGDCPFYQYPNSATTDVLHTPSVEEEKKKAFEMRRILADLLDGAPEDLEECFRCSQRFTITKLSSCSRYSSESIQTSKNANAILSIQACN